jgi:hypothetical protein
MRISRVHWEEWNQLHIAEHDLSPDEVNSVLLNPHAVTSVSRSSGRIIRSGLTNSGRLISVIFEVLDANEGYVYPITAFEINRLPRRRKKR